MVKNQLERRGISDSSVLQAMSLVQRHRYVPENLRDRAYGDHPLPIGNNQTISQPYIVALMTEMLEINKDHNILEVGTGSGYQAAILGQLAHQVHTIEIIPDLADRAEKILSDENYHNINY